MRPTVRFPSDDAICRLVNQLRNENGFRDSAESTRCLNYTVNTIGPDELEMDVAQSHRG